VSASQHRSTMAVQPSSATPSPPAPETSPPLEAPLL
jgi:hypothetical protein